MKKKGVFQPAIALMNRLRYVQKFSLISFIFFLPIGLLMYLLLTEVQSRSDFTEKEIFGNAYLRPLRKIWTDVPNLKLASQNCTDVKSFQINQAKNSQLESQIDRNFQELQAIDDKYGRFLKTAERLQATQQIWAEIKTIRTQQGACDLEKQNKIYNRLIEQVQSLRSHVGDTSNLILDPDLDTYYLMDATLLKLPAIQSTIFDTKLIIHKAAKTQNLSLSQRGDIIALLGNIRDTKEELKRNMETAFQNNPQQNLRLKLIQPVNKFTEEIDKITAQADLLLDTKFTPELNYSLLQLEQITQQTVGLWETLIQEQDLLLQNRINGFVSRQINMSIFVILILIIVAYLYIGFYLGVRQTVLKLSDASKQMVEGNITERVELENRDELADVVKSFNNVAAALVVANKEITQLYQKLEVENVRMSAELEVTSRLQEMILPKEKELSEIPGLDIAGYMKPADEVGGDYYDVLHHNGRVKFGIGDVTGHGLESGVLMIMVQTAVRTLQEINETDPKRFLDIINRTIYRNVQRMQSDKNLTLSLLDYEHGKLRITGQHEEMIIVRQNGQVERFDTIDLGFPIGLESDITDFIGYVDVELEVGDFFVLYTDGITEAENMQGEQYGIEKLIEVLQANSRRSAHQIRHAVVQDVRQFIGEQKVFDDMTLVIIKQKSEAKTLVGVNTDN